MTDYQQRVVNEFRELDDRLGKIHVFIEESPVFKTLSKLDQRLLVDQRAVMSMYAGLLRERMSRFQNAA